MRRLILALLIIGTDVHAQEVATLTTPVFVTASASTLRLAVMRIDVHQETIEVLLKEFTSGAFVEGRVLSVTYHATGSTSNVGTTTVEANAGRTLIRLLNTANLSTLSLEKRILQRLIADKHLSGSVTGAPQ